MAFPSILHIDTGMTFRGGQRQLLLLSQKLAKMGIHQIIACPEGSGLMSRIEGISTVALSNYSLLRKILIGPLKNAVAEYGMQILHAHDSEAHTIGIFLKKSFPELRLVVTRRVVFSPSSVISRNLKYKKGVDGFIAISKAVAESLAGIGIKRERITLIPSALDIQGIKAVYPDYSIREELPADCEFLIVSAGALTVEKDFVTAIEAVKLITEKTQGIGLIILGEGPERSRLEKIIDSSATDRIRLLGYREPMAPIFKACDLFLLTSTSEGLNSSAIEAAACSLPLVVSNVGGLPEIAEQEYNGILCPPGRPEIFAEAILNLAQDDENRRRMAENSARRSEKFDIASATSQIVDFYKSLLAE